jgi:hypothetical protein
MWTQLLAPITKQSNISVFNLKPPHRSACEATDRNIGVYGPVMIAESKAAFLRTYSRSVTLPPVETSVDARTIKRMHEAGITLAPSVPVNFRAGDGDVSVELQNVDHLQFDALYPELGCKVHSDLASNLGARCNDVGCLEVDQKQQSIYAASDVVSDLYQLARRSWPRRHCRNGDPQQPANQFSLVSPASPVNARSAKFTVVRKTSRSNDRRFGFCFPDPMFRSKQR